MISGFNNITHFQWHTCFIQKKNKRVSPLNAFPWVVIPAKRGQVEVQFDFDVYTCTHYFIFLFTLHKV